jgi:two-component system response regulator HydG
MSRLGRHVLPLGGAAYALACLILGLPGWRGDWRDLLTVGLALAAGLLAADAAQWAHDPTRRRLLLVLGALSPVTLVAPTFQLVEELSTLGLLEAALVLDALWTLSWTKGGNGDRRGRGRALWLVLLYGGALVCAGVQARLGHSAYAVAAPLAWGAVCSTLLVLAALGRLLHPADLNQEVSAHHTLWCVAIAAVAAGLAAWLSAGRIELIWAVTVAALIREVGRATRDLREDRTSFSVREVLAPVLVAALVGAGVYAALLGRPGLGPETAAGAIVAATVLAWPLSQGARALLERLPPRSTAAIERAARDVEERADEAESLHELVTALSPLATAFPRGAIALVTFDPDWTLVLRDGEVEHRFSGPGATLRDLLATPFHTMPLLARQVVDRSVREFALRQTAELVEELHAELVVPVPGGAASPLVGALFVGGPRRGRLRGWIGGRLLQMARPLGIKIRAAVEIEAAGRRTREAEAAHALAEDRAERLEFRLELLGEENRLLRADRAGTRSTEVVGRSEAMTALLVEIERAARVPSSLLVRGESGTGRTLVARSIHEASDRAEGPMVLLDCAGTPQATHREALVGRADGGLSRPGLIELADQGTLVLEEVGALSLDAQAELVRLISTGEIARAQGSEGRPSLRHVDVRVVATTGRTAERALAEDALLPDLHDRLRAIQINVPPLRERRGDTPQLARFFLEKAIRRHGLALEGISPEAIDALERYRWPGNVRQLRAVIEHAALSARGRWLSRSDLPSLADASETPAPTVGELLVGTFDEIEREVLVHALARAKGNKTEAAKLLGLKRTTFVSRLQKHRLDAE